MSSTAEERKEFVKRLVWACDESPHIPPHGHGRQQYICERLGVAPEAVSKWFKGVSKPRTAKMRELAELLGVTEGWLHYGEKIEQDRRGMRKLARGADGAVHLVWGLIALSGGNCGTLASSDPRHPYVDFVATIQGMSYPIRVTLAREVEPDHFEVTVPKEFREVYTIGVFPISVGRFHFLNMPSALIEQHKVLKGGDFVLTVERTSGNKYSTGGAHWPRIVSFAEFADD